MDNILLTPQLMVNALALLTLLLVAFALGVPVAVLAVLLKLDVVQRFLAQPGKNRDTRGPQYSLNQGSMLGAFFIHTHVASWSRWCYLRGGRPGTAC